MRSVTLAVCLIYALPWHSCTPPRTYRPPIQPAGPPLPQKGLSGLRPIHWERLSIITPVKRLLLPAATLSLSVLIASCGGQSSTPQPEFQPDAAVTASVITDKVVGWTAGRTGRISVVEYSNNNVADAVVLTSAAVDAQGNFSLTLPTGAQVAPYLVEYQTTPRDGCTGFFTSSVPGATHYNVDTYLLEDTTTNKVLSRNFVQNNPGFSGSQNKVGDYFIERVYAAQSHTVTGTLSCPTFRATLNLNLKAGWNAVVDTVDALAADGSIRDYTIKSVTTLPANLF